MSVTMPNLDLTASSDRERCMSVTMPNLDLTAVFARNRELFGDLRMEEGDEAAKAAADAAAKEAADRAAADEAAGKNSEVDHAAEAAKWKALSRKHEEQSKANADKAKQFDALEEANKTELEKAQARAEAAEKKAAENEMRTLRLEVAGEKGVPAALIAGSTKEELEASADALLVFRGEKPKPDFGGGDRGNSVTDKPDFETQIAEARKARDFTRVVALREQQAAEGAKKS